VSYADFLEARRIADRHWRRWQKLHSEAEYEPTSANRSAAEREHERYLRALAKVKQVRAAWLGRRTGKTA